MHISLKPYSGWDFLWMLIDGVVQKDFAPLNLSQISYNDGTWHSYILLKEGTKAI